MEQRPLRLGDIVDDYCPRERRLTNHAIVALVEQSIRQTRCTTCDTEHVYKDGRLPRRKKGADGEDLIDLSGGLLRRPAPVEPESAHPAMAATPANGDASVAAPPVQASPVVGGATEETNEVEAEVARDDDRGNLWPAHRQLIRAQLPRTEGDPPPVRPIPEFTMHQRQGRGGHGFRHGGGPSWSGGTGQPRSNGFRGGPERNGNVGDPPRGIGGGGAGAGGGRPGRHRGRGRRSR